jgi:hypothetical protein
VALSLAVALALAGRAVRSYWRSAEAHGLARLVESSAQSEREGRLGDALAELEAAVALAGHCPPPPHELEGLRQHRDDLALREARACLAALEPGGPAPPVEPGRAVGEALTLLARASKDEALAGLEPAILGALERLRQRWAEADSAAARKAFVDGRHGAAMELCERQYRTAGELPTPLRCRLQEEATDLARRLIGQYGTVVEPVRGQFTLGSAASYDAQIRPHLVEALLKRGYLPRRSRGSWDDLWDSAAPFRVSFEVVENQHDVYLESRNLMSRLQGRVRVTRGGAEFWRDSPIAQTEVPLPGVSAYLAAQVAAGLHRNPDCERLLYENARTNFMERFGMTLRNIPPCPATDS